MNVYASIVMCVGNQTSFTIQCHAKKEVEEEYLCIYELVLQTFSFGMNMFGESDPDRKNRSQRDVNMAL